VKSPALYRRFIPALFLVTTSLPAQRAPDTTVAIVSGPLGVRADSLLAKLTEAGFSGVTLVAKDGRVVLKKGYGLADRAAGVPMSGSSVVQIGSNTKDFTIVAILQLMERGKLALTDPITKYFPAVPDDKRTITIEQLLTHRAGFDQHLGPDFDLVTRDEEIARALSATLLFSPGTDRKYSNIGYSLLAVIIEMVSGSSYDAYVRDNILVPLGLRDTGLLLPRFDRRRVAHGYRNGKDMGTFIDRPLATDGPYWNLRGNGGMLSTVSDMYRFYRALMSDGGGILTPASRDLFFHPDRAAVLAGSDLTFFFFYSRNPGAGLDVILASNSTDYPAPKARNELARVLGVGDPSRIDGPSIQTSIDTASPRRVGAAEPVAFPDTPAGRAAKRFVQIHAEGDAATVRKFLEQEVIQRPEDHRTLNERVAAFATMRQNLGVLAPTAITTSAPLEITFQARSTEGILTFTIDVEKQAPHRITGIRVEAQ